VSKVTEKGQVTIPKELRERLGIRPGDEVSFEETADGVVIRKEVSESRFERWRGIAETDESVSERMEELRGRRE
jgi:AbrB family looped-hinge helix DNA binding protein